MCNDLNINDEQKLKFFHNIFDDEAKRMYQSSILKQRRFIYRSMWNLVIAENKISDDEDWDYSKKTFIKYAVQGPPHQQSDYDLVEYMHDSVTELGCAQIVTTQCAAAGVPWKIQKFFTALDAARPHHEKLTQTRKVIHQLRSTANDILVASWNRQSICGRPNTPGSSLFAPNRAKPFWNKLPARECYYCGETDHSIKECTSLVCVKVSVSRLSCKDMPYAPNVMFQLFTWVEDSLAEKNVHEDTLQQSHDYDSDEYVAHVLIHLSDEEHPDSDRDQSTLEKKIFLHIPMMVILLIILFCLIISFILMERTVTCLNGKVHVWILVQEEQ